MWDYRTERVSYLITGKKVLTLIENKNDVKFSPENIKTFDDSCERTKFIVPESIKVIVGEVDRKPISVPLRDWIKAMVDDGLERFFNELFLMMQKEGDERKE